jgi:GxxExxY protein
MNNNQSMRSKPIDLIYKDETYAIIGAAMEVYNELGPGFLEAIYQEAFELELTGRRIPFIHQSTLTVIYKGKLLAKSYSPDLVAYDKIVIELKATNQLSSIEQAQLLNYLKATNYKLGLLINFGHSNCLDWKGWS